MARILKTRGIKGEVVAELLTDFPERFEGLTKVIATLGNAKREELQIRTSFFSERPDSSEIFGLRHDRGIGRPAKRGDAVPESEAVELGEDEYFRLAA